MTPRRRRTSRARRAAALAAGLLALAAFTSGSAALSVTRSLMIDATPIAAFAPNAPGRRFGPLEYVGGFQYMSSDSRLRGVSAIRLLANRSRFLAVTDTGFWFRGTIARDADGRPTGFAAAEMAPILGPAGEAQTRRKGIADAEGLAIDGDRVLVAFERRHRIEAFADPSDPLDRRPTAIRQPIPIRELRGNAGIETVAVAPATAKGGARTVIVTEQSIDADGDLFAAILGREGGVFKVRRQLPWHVTDGAFLPDGDLLLLERRAESFGRVGMRIRRIAGASIRPGALVDGEVLIEADLGEEIDNMEGLDVSVGSDGSTYLALVSDDNGSVFQRNLYLEFRMVEDGPKTGALRPN